MLNLWRSSSTKEKYWLFALIAITLVLTSGPYFYGWLNTPAGSQYNGLHAFAGGDVHVYYTYIEQVKRGDFLLADLYTLEPHAKTLNIFWLGVGLAAKIFNLSAELAYQLARLVWTVVLLGVIYLYCVYFFRSRGQRLLAAGLATFSGGLGALLSGLINSQSKTSYGYYHWPADLWLAESNTFLTLLHSPHFIASLSGVLLFFLFTLLALDRASLRLSLGAGLTGLFLFQFHPFQIFTTLPILLAFGLTLFIWRPKALTFYLKHLGVVILLASPSLAYYLWLGQTDWLTTIKTIQNITLTPVPWLMIISYGLLWPLAIYGLFKLFKQLKLNETDNLKWLWLATWLAVQLLLIYSPLPFQRRLSTGLQINLGLLATLGLNHLWSLWKKFFGWNQFLTILVLMLLFVGLFGSPLHNLAREIVVSQQQNNLVYFTPEETAMFQWIRAKTPPEASFLTLKIYGNFIPGQTGRGVFYGHGVETALAQGKLALARWAYTTAAGNSKIIAKLHEKNIDYVVFSIKEKTFDSKLKTSLGLIKEFANESIQIYSVNYD